MGRSMWKVGRQIWTMESTSMLIAELSHGLVADDGEQMKWPHGWQTTDQIYVDIEAVYRGGGDDKAEKARQNRQGKGCNQYVYVYIYMYIYMYV